MTEEERKQKAREYAKKYYEEHKEERKIQMKEYSKKLRLENNIKKKDYIEKLAKKNLRQKNIVKKYKNIIDNAINYVEDKGRLKYKPNELIKILKGEINYE